MDEKKVMLSKFLNNEISGEEYRKFLFHQEEYEKPVMTQEEALRILKDLKDENKNLSVHGRDDCDKKAYQENVDALEYAIERLVKSNG